MAIKIHERTNTRRTNVVVTNSMPDTIRKVKTMNGVVDRIGKVRMSASKASKIRSAINLLEKTPAKDLLGNRRIHKIRNSELYYYNVTPGTHLVLDIDEISDNVVICDILTRQ